MKVSYEKYHAFSSPLEGRVPTFYCDILGLITIAVGNLVNTLPQALALPMFLADGTKADQADIAADWHKLHDNAQHYAKLAWTVYTKTMRCHLSEEGIDALVQRTLAANERIIVKRFPAWESFPADAQLAIMSIAWAVGAGFYEKFGNLAKCIDAQDWEGCVATCKIREENNPGVVPRNAKNRFCFHNAAIVRVANSDAGVLWWPAVAAPGGASVVAVPPDMTTAATAAQIDSQAALDAFVNAEALSIEQQGAAGAQREYDNAGNEPEPEPDPAA